MKDELRGAVQAGARRRGTDILRMLTDETERKAAAREKLAIHAEALRLFVPTEVGRWDEQSNSEKVLGIIAVRLTALLEKHVIALCLFTLLGRPSRFGDGLLRI